MLRTLRRLARHWGTPLLGAAIAAGALTVGTPPAGAAYPGANGKIAWARPTEPSGHGSWDIWIMNPDGTSPTNLLPAGVDEEHPAWSPDGTRIAFSRPSSTPSGCALGDIWVMGADGSNVAQLTTSSLGTAATQPTWSPDGTRIAYAQAQQDPTCNDGDSEIWVMNADGSGQTAITSGGPTIGNSDGEPAWSPDGTRIAFTGMRTNAQGNRPAGIFTINPDGSQITRLTGDPISFITASAPAWSPDGQRIAYERKDAFTGSHEIWLMNADGTGKTAVTSNGFLSNMSPVWSPDGRQIAFSGQDDQVTFDNEIFVIDVDGTGQTAITSNTTGDSFPDWQPRPAAADPEPPTLTDTDPDSPANDNGPRVKGTAPGAATVTLFTSPDCSGTPAAQGAVADFASPGLQVAVPDNSSTTFRATATNAAGRVSACSSSSLTYVEESAPPPPPTGLIEIRLDSGEGQDVEFTGVGPSALEFFTLDDDNDATLSNGHAILNAAAGLWTISQQLLVGWNLTAISCDDPDAGSSSNLLTATAQIDLDADEHITCTFTNRRPPPADTTPPTLTLPASFAVDATGPAGAIVGYAVTASDGVDPAPSLTCAPPSGSVLPIGTTTVTCTAADNAGNTTVGSFTVRVSGAAQQLVQLIAKTLVFLELPGIAEALTARLEAAADAPVGDRRRACAAIRTYQTLVRLLPAILLAPTEKAELLADAARIGRVVGC